MFLRHDPTTWSSMLTYRASGSISGALSSRKVQELPARSFVKLTFIVCFISFIIILELIRLVPWQGRKEVYLFPFPWSQKRGKGWSLTTQCDPKYLGCDPCTIFFFTCFLQVHELFVLYLCPSLHEFLVSSSMNLDLAPPPSPLSPSSPPSPAPAPNSN